VPGQKYNLSAGQGSREKSSDGSGLYHLDGFTGQKWVKVRLPSAAIDDFLTGTLSAQKGCISAQARARHVILPAN